MIHNLKALIAAATMLTAVGAIIATGAHAAEEKFHCSVEPCTLTLKQDGIGSTAHSVFVMKGESNDGTQGSTISFTCSQVTASVTSLIKTMSEAKVADAYDGCKIVGVNYTVSLESCFYRFTSAGGGTAMGSVAHLECTTPGDGIALAINGITCIKITPLTVTGIKYHDVGVKEEELTVELSSIELPATAVHLENVNSASCAAVGLKTVEAATFTTGHANITAETDPGGTLARFWFT